VHRKKFIESNQSILYVVVVVNALHCKGTAILHCSDLQHQQDSRWEVVVNQSLMRYKEDNRSTECLVDVLVITGFDW